MNDRDKTTLTLLLGQCCCPDETPPKPQRPQRPAVHGRPMTPRAPQSDEPVPFVASAPSFDSPQRAVPGHGPSVNAAGAFLPGGMLTEGGGFVLDTGEVRTLREFAALHPARVLEFIDRSTVTTRLPDARQFGVPSHYARSELGGDPRVAPFNRSEYFLPATEVAWVVRRQPMSGGPPTEQTVTTTGTVSVMTGQVQMSGYVVTDYRFQIRWARQYGPADSPAATWRRSQRVIAVFPGGTRTLATPPYESFEVLHAYAEDHSRAVWEAMGQPPGADDPIDPESGFPIWETLVTGRLLADVGVPRTPPEPQPADGRWISPDGRVRVTGPRTLDHALIDGRVGDRLTAYGFTGAPDGTGPAGRWVGSWAGLCGPLREDGTPDPWVLYEEGEAVTLIRPDGVSSLGRAAFEREILRVPRGSFLRFVQAGQLTHTWPPQWAVADCGAAGGARAVTLHEPWRDSAAGKPPEGSGDPAWWWWPTRPRKRPASLPPDAPAAPLRLALADVWQSADPDPGGGSS